MLVLVEVVVVVAVVVVVEVVVVVVVLLGHVVFVGYPLVAHVVEVVELEFEAEVVAVGRLLLHLPPPRHHVVHLDLGFRRRLLLHLDFGIDDNVPRTLETLEKRLRMAVFVLDMLARDPFEDNMAFVCLEFR